MNPKPDQLLKDVYQIISAAIEAVQPRQLIRGKIKLRKNILTIDDVALRLDLYAHIYLVGAGKASASMALELEKILGTRISGGVISTKYGHSVPCKRVKVIEAGHPVLDQNGLDASDVIYRLAVQARKEDLVICLFSGGGSALLERLPDGISMSDLQRVFEILLKCGANVDEINIVRKHISTIKGGQLARAIVPARCVSIILSDVIGDHLESIASGPTAPNSKTFNDALDILAKYKIDEMVPANVLQYLKHGAKKKSGGELDSDDRVFNNVTNIILGNNLGALKMAKREAVNLGYNTIILSSRIQGEAKEVAKFAAAIVQEIHSNNNPVKKPACVLFGGETTVTVRGNGKGGRNQELALASLAAMANTKYNYMIASCGTDGSDGPTDAAGGIASPAIAVKAKKLGLNLSKFLDNNDSYNFFEKVGGLIRIGATGTNVMDLVISIIPQ
jgi:glycerate 2-kinase